ncbi:tRNA 5-methoxyuridine(34)/uridine 5-oxyacetic acid(34) synthase CmoB [Candidatus Riesia pediculicola]|uniref:tRNA U34 carboxymethyltransferase n=1 Tax=Riesia pediculicola (strain USDA) TaxID=515618 RepID=D4G8A4_RIEPU|nr:tRNA 5-methoxyuridine(34)/uridine 5-oxyacetic acid(34) synthase CmoB [Candidatus Riesia pediculicola]ADD79847.1 conserved hypothetical protein [Candidatus Riesia pediculicola USDA]ARC53798.1 hypothetical protein AOE55_01375 [Candidatus Riesia pediculicola]QOJ86433.1 tRNA 5-methoxyuridine(34)/uridine 5-oxyacetic acid(34) synthase CmoB [Candidatus Riesia pediculicola]
MSNFTKFYESIFIIFFKNWLQNSKEKIKDWKKFFSDKKFDHFERIVENIPKMTPNFLNIETKISVTSTKQDNIHLQKRIKNLLFQLSPWKKGPFEMYGIKIDSEWKSYLKWKRIIPHISLKDKIVLDVGCGNGYYLWRILGKEAKSVIGLDPSIYCFFQFKAIEKLIGKKKNLNFLPIRIENIPHLKIFDTIFSMGVIYHQKSPIEHLNHLKNQLKDDGELILESLTIHKKYGNCLVPAERYSGMKNIYFIPSIDMLKIWLLRCGFSEVEIINQSVTSKKEQRATDWSKRSLLQFRTNLNDVNLNFTEEGYPSPTRTILLVRKKKKFTEIKF